MVSTDSIGHVSNTRGAFPFGVRAQVHAESIGQLIQTAVASLDGDPIRARIALLRVRDLLKGSPDATSWPVPRPSREIVRGGLASWQVRKLLAYIESRLEYPITGQELSALVGISRGQLFRAFKVTVGTQPLRYVAAMRIRRAQLLMCTTREPLARIAAACGLCDQSHFCRTFLRIVGQSPARWRREHSPEPVQSESRPRG